MSIYIFRYFIGLSEAEVNYIENMDIKNRLQAINNAENIFGNAGYSSYDSDKVFIAKANNYEEAMQFILKHKVMLETGFMHRITFGDWTKEIRKTKQVTNAWKPAIRLLDNSSLILKTKDYFDLRDISTELYCPRVGTLLRTGASKQTVVHYEVKKWVSKDRPEYENSGWLINQAIEYIQQANRKRHS